MAGSKHMPPEAKAAEHKPRKIVTTFGGLVATLERETTKLRAVDTYLNDVGKRRLAACEQIAFLTGFCDTASDLTELDLYDELGDDADVVRDVLMAVTRIAKLEEGRK